MPNMVSHRNRGLLRCVAILASALGFCWVELFNGFPLLYTDSLSYLLSGRGVWTRLFGIPTPEWLYASDRSEIYAATIYLMHRGSALGSLVAVQAILTAWILWLTVRALTTARHALRVYLTLVAGILLFTNAAWYVSVIMPDILGPLLYLTLYLLVFKRESLSRWEHILLLVFAFWAMTAHATHLAVAATVLALLAALWLAGWSGMRQRAHCLLPLVALLLAASGTQLAVHGRLYGRQHISLFGLAPPFLMARLISDGPARIYLQQHCSNLQWIICSHGKDLPTNESDFLWPATGIWRSSTLYEQDRLRGEQTPLLLATLRSYPLQQIAISWHHFTYMLFVVGPTDFGPTPFFTRAALDRLLPGLGPRYEQTVQSRNQLHQIWFRRIETVSIRLSMLITVLSLPWLWKQKEDELLGLAIVVVAALITNAFLSGVVSCDDTRLQDRVTWLIAVVAGLIAMRSFGARNSYRRG